MSMRIFPGPSFATHVLIFFSLLLVGCSRSSHEVILLEENGVPLIRNTGGPLHKGPPFTLVRDAVFGDPAIDPEGLLLDPQGYVEIPRNLSTKVRHTLFEFTEQLPVAFPPHLA